LERTFKPNHINATIEDLQGNNGIGRYFLLPGSDGRARKISKLFKDVRVLESSRSHNIYLGTLEVEGKKIDVASVSTGMGCPSLDIIVNELFKLGAKRFIRVGTAGSMQSDRIPVGHIVIATGAVRDEHTSLNYVPLEYPSIASIEILSIANELAKKEEYKDIAHFGIVHAKDSLFAREFKEGPMPDQNAEYMKILERSGVLASEMESSHLFVLSSLFNHKVQKVDPSDKVLAGTVLAIIGDDKQQFSNAEEVKEQAIVKTIDFGLDVIKNLALSEVNF